MAPNDPSRSSAIMRGLTLALAVVATLVMIALTIPATREANHQPQPADPVHIARRF